MLRSSLLIAALAAGCSNELPTERSVAGAAAVTSPCLTISPKDLNFGTIVAGCSSASRTFAIYNTCSTAVPIVSAALVLSAGEPAFGPDCPGPRACPEFVAVPTAGITAGSMIQPGSTPVTFKLAYRPINVGTDNGAFLIQAQEDSVVLDYVVTLSGTGEMAGINQDAFHSDRAPRLDLLVVLDASASMANRQASLMTNFTRFIDRLVTRHLDFQLAVTSADLSQGGGAIVGDVANPKILTLTTPDVANKFLLKLVAVGKQGGNTAPMLAATTAALQTANPSNERVGLLRDAATWIVLAVSDRDDQSPGRVDEYVRWMQALSRGRGPYGFAYNSIGPSGLGTASGCRYNGVAGSPRTSAAVVAMNGSEVDICDVNWEQSLFGSATTQNYAPPSVFFLTAAPIGTPTVTVNGVPVAPESGSSLVWIYDPASNSITFTPGHVPPGGSTTIITYTLACFP